MNTKKEKSRSYVKTEPTLFPYGFGINRIDNEIIVLDFFDALPDGGDQRIVASVAMPLSRAETLAKAILRVEDETDEAL
ncbi:hypothetical protein MRBLRH8O_001853 [Agrobacterium radiobacter]|uniref:hypothetical protein n=1 Tax=Agrobacterium radiobacter TaxID=362 RepID=UPI0034660B24